MVVKSRSRIDSFPYTINGVQAGSNPAFSRVNETMEDSSVTGSPRTEKDEVDRFLENPTNRGDFHRALQAANKSYGDVGLADFRVTRVRERNAPRTFVIPPTTPGGPSFTNKNWGMRSSDIALSKFPKLDMPDVPTPAQLKARGQKLYHSALPNRDQADLGTTIAEIVTNPVRALTLPGFRLADRAAKRRAPVSDRDLQRAVKQRHHRIEGLSLDDARAAADDYLAYIFGVRPTVKSLDDLAESISRSRYYAEKVSRQGFKRIRRRRTAKVLSDIASTHHSGILYPMRTGNTWVYFGNYSRFTEYSQRTWYSASYRMATSDTDSWLERSSDFFKRIDRITGLGLDIRVAWDLIPFSFMADWFANTGDFLEARQVISDYNVTCEYGYVMCHTRKVYTLVGSGGFGHYASGPSVPGSVFYTRLEETKLRTRGGAFGFYTDFSNLNSFQWAALAALGASNAAGIPPKSR